MKTLFILVLLIFVTSCKNPFDKYKDSVDDLQTIINANIAAAGRVEQSLTTIAGIVSGVNNWESLSDGDISTLSTNFSAIAQEITSGNMDVLLANIADYVDETDELIDNIEVYQAQLTSAISALDPGPQKDALVSIQSSVTSVVQYLTNKGVLGN